MHIETITELLNIPFYKVSEIIKNDKSKIILSIDKMDKFKISKLNCSCKSNIKIHSYYFREIEDLPMFDKRVFLKVKIYRYRCLDCNKISIDNANWIFNRKTIRFAKMVNRLTSITTNKEAGWFLNIDDEVVYRIDKKILEKQADEKLRKIEPPKNMSVDEVAYKKYHNYLTNVIDVDKKVVIWNEKGRKSAIFDQFFELVGRENCKKIESISLDGARSYIKSSKSYAKNAIIVYDKFHLVQALNKTIDAVRKQELLKAKKENNEELIELTNSKSRFILLKNKGKLTLYQQTLLDKLYKLNETICKAMLLKESFLNIYNCKTIKEAEEYIIEWIQEVEKSNIEQLILFTKKVKDKMQYIVNWFKKKISSAISEGFNNKIKRLQRMAYGYKDIEYLKLKIHQHCGLLNPRFQQKHE